MGYLQLLLLCYRAYNGDVSAAMQVIGTLKGKLGL